MCGLAGFYIKDQDYIKTEAQRHQMEVFFDELLLGIETRGRDATGFAAVAPNGRMCLDKAAVPASSFVKTRKKFPKDTRIVMGHVRLATQGHQSNYLNNHPVTYKDVLLTHNGMIPNDYELFKKHDIPRYAEVDSEIIAAMLHKTGFKKPEKALGELRGGFACAALQLSKPEELLLFKGPTFSLSYHDNKKMFVWASTAHAIKHAWQKVLGTPPEWAKFQTIDEGSVIRITDGEVKIETKVFTSPGYNYSRSNWNGWNEDWNDTTGKYPRSNIKKTNKKNRGRATIVDRSEAVSKLRAEGKGRALTWYQRMSMTAEQKLDHNGKWDHCMSCHQGIARFHMVDTLVWGSICIDCYDVANKRTEIKDTYKNFKDIEELEEMSSVDGKIHYTAIARVSDETNMSIGAITYLLFRATNELLLKKKAWQRLHADLLEKYEEAVAEEWIAWEDELMNEQEELEEIRAKENGWVNCARGTHHIGDKCDACGPILELDVGDIFEDFDECGVTVFADSGKSTSIAVMEKPKELPKAWQDHLEDKKKNSMRKTCMLCPKTPTIYKTTKFAWCLDHWNTCGIKDCDERPKGFNPEGVRLCHLHIRGVRGALFDKDGRGIAKKAKELAGVK